MSASHCLWVSASFIGHLEREDEKLNSLISTKTSFIEHSYRNNRFNFYLSLTHTHLHTHKYTHRDGNRVKNFNRNNLKDKLTFEDSILKIFLNL